MKNLLIVLATIILSASAALGQWEEKGDTIIVQTLSYDSITTRSGTWQFPPADQYEKILMHYSLKCDPRTTRDNFECGEWDYLTYTVLTDSSGRFDSTQFSSPNFRVRGKSPNKYYYTNTPYNYKEQETIYKTSFGDGLTERNEVNFNEGEGDTIEVSPTSSKAFFVSMQFDNAELIDFKNNHGEIHSLKLKFLESVKIKNFRIKLKNQNNMLKNDVLNDKTAIYLDDIEVVKDELKEFILFAPHKLESLNGLSVVISGEIEEGSLVLEQGVENLNQKRSYYYLGGQNYVKFNQGSYIDVPKEVFTDLDKEITIAFWQYGDRVKMPQNSYAFEGVNTQGQRVVNSHLPWSNGQVYWDAGNNGGSYDRISKQANNSDFKGKWNHWAFTKNTETGIMKIYLNGEEWLSGEEKTNGFDKIEKFKIASSANGNGQYDGSMDNFAIWNRVLTEGDIKTIMGREYQTNNQQAFWIGLLMYYDMNNIQDNIVLDNSENGHNGTIHGFAESRGTKTDELRIFDSNQPLKRPAITFVNANFTGAVDINKDKQEILREYPMPMDEVLLYDYEGPNSILSLDEIESFSELIKTPTSTLSVYPANQQIHVYDEFGFVIDSVFAVASDSIIREDINYYSPIADYELHRFITPYGINLDLGPDGFTWVEDVTDFGPLLQDYVKLSAGNQQELIDLKFLFVKGTPARDVKSVQTMWSRGGNFPRIEQNLDIATIELTPNKDASTFRALTRSSGHRFAGGDNTDNCAEFCKRTHKLYVGDGEFEWEGWKECGDNPVFPQGGTWQIDRADWCPGATVTTHKHDLTPFLTPGVSEFIDYDIVNPPQYIAFGDYVFTGYLIGYGEANFTNDASIERIVSPSLDQEYGRLNPACSGPEIIIKNNGSSELGSLEFEYGIKDGEKASYTWKGNLKFLEEQKITLPPVDMNSLSAGVKYEFEFTIINTNGIEDEYKKNNYAVSEFIGVDVLSSDVTINLKTNNSANSQYRMVLKTANGKVIREVKLGEFENNKNYKFENNLEIGCYELLFENELGFGLDLWWMRDQLGTGYINITSGNSSVNFNPDFGNFIKYQFSVGQKPEILITKDTLNFGDVAIGERAEKSFFVEPGNEKGLFIREIEMGLADKKGMALVKPIDSEKDIPIPYGQKYELIFSFEPKDDNPRISPIYIKTNADNVPSYKLVLIGNTGISNVEESFDDRFETKIITTSFGESNLEITNKRAVEENILIDMYNMEGKFVSNIWEGTLLGNRVIIPLNVTNLNSGVFLIKIRNRHFNKDLKFIHIK